MSRSNEFVYSHMNTQTPETLEAHLCDLIQCHTLEAVLNQLSYAIIDMARKNKAAEDNLRFIAQQIHNLRDYAKIP